MVVPSYLSGYDESYGLDPRGAALRWFEVARYGLFLHYGLYSVDARHEWIQYLEKIPVAQYERLIDSFTAEKFSAGYICDLAIDAGMKYVNITTRHHDSFCLFRTAQTQFNSLNAPAGRDLVGELADACRERGLGLFFYYSHGRDWRHPHGPRNEDWGGAPRPKYDRPDPAYAPEAEYDMSRYVDFVSAQITELLTQYGPVAGIWLDGRGVPLSGDWSKFCLTELYESIHQLQPQCLISYKEGVTGTEDFRAPEYKAAEQDDKPVEICATLFPGKLWGFSSEQIHQSKTPEEVWEMIRAARRRGANLLLNTGPCGDGSIHPVHDRLLREVGARLREERFPA